MLDTSSLDSTRPEIDYNIYGNITVTGFFMQLKVGPHGDHIPGSA